MTSTIIYYTELIVCIKVVLKQINVSQAGHAQVTSVIRRAMSIEDNTCMGGWYTLVPCLFAGFCIMGEFQTS